MKINFKKSWLAFLLLAINLSLLFLHLYYGKTWDFFNFDKEWNLPTAWSAIQLSLAGVLWFSFTEIKKNAKIKETLRTVYRFLGSSVFFYLATDELFQLHEKLGDIGGDFLLQTTWHDYFALNRVFAWLWVFLPVILMFLAIVIYHGWRVLSRQTFLLLSLGVTVFLLGAYGIEIIGWLVWHDKLHLNYWYLVSLEETLEMMGVSILVVVLSKDILRK